MIALGTHPLKRPDGTTITTINVITIYQEVDRTTAHASPLGPLLETLAAIGEEVLIGDTPALVSRVDARVDLIDTTTQKFWAEHRRRDYVAGHKEVTLELLLLEG